MSAEESEKSRVIGLQKEAECSEGDLEHPQSTHSGDEGTPIEYVQGVRYWAMGFIVFSMILLTTMDMTIAGTSLVAISVDLGDFDVATWIFTSYLLGYVAVIVICAKLSDIIGRKTVTVASIIIFTGFSAGCAAAQTMTQLIIVRAMQGVGAGGSFALAAALLIEMVPPEQYAEAVTKFGVSVVLALVLGPILGGAISENTTWRWIFLINIPIGVISILVALFGIPNGFPYQNRPRPEHLYRSERVSMMWKKLDYPGAILILLATLSFTACFQETGSTFEWGSAFTITLLIISTFLWTSLLLWERHVTLADGIREPVLPWRFFKNRASLGLFTCIIFVGPTVAVTNYQLPQRFMLVNGVSSFGAAIRVIPFGAASAVGTVLSGQLASKLKVPSIYLIIVGALLQIAGYALLGTLQTSSIVERKVYAFEIVAGLGCAFSFSNSLLLVAFTAEKRDGAVAMGAANQFRFMGSAVGLAIVTSIFNEHVPSRLSKLGVSYPLDISIAGQHDSVPTLQREIREVLSVAYNYQMLALCGFGAAQIPAALLMWRRKQVVVA